MDPCSTTVPGSRRPITVPILLQQHSALPPAEPEAADSTTPSSLHTSSGIRRKPLRTYKSLLAHRAIGLRVEDSQYPKETVGSDTSHKRPISEKYNDESRYATDSRLNGPPLPLYHPQGGLALSLPELDPAELGLPNPISIDDHDVRTHDHDTSRRASSRARRPPAKLRDRDIGDENEAAAGLNGVVNGKAIELQARAASPRKRRAAGGGKRKRKDVDDADGTYPNPPKRSRNPRGVGAGAVASPLTGLATTADDVDMDASAAADVPDGDEARSDVMDVQEQKPTMRSRRRPQIPKRRGSSASETTATSASVSIAINARKPRSGPSPPKFDDEKEADVEMPIVQPAVPPDQEPQEQEPQPSAPRNDKSGSDTSEKPMELSTPPEPVEDPQMDVDNNTQDVSVPDEAPKKSVSEPADGEPSAAIIDLGPKKPPLPPPDEPSALAEPHGVPTSVRDATISSTAPASTESTKDTCTPTQAPADSKPPPSPAVPLETQTQPAERITPPSAPRQAEKPVMKPPEPAPDDEKEEGELSEDS